MNAALTPAPKAPVVYPESDGKPMADNTKQARWIVLLYTGLAGLFRQDSDVFVAADLNWYPVEGEPSIVNAPDVLVAFGRPKGDRPSYKQWQEGGVAPQVVFEILSPGNDFMEMIDKFSFYDDHGAEEYYVYDPERDQLVVFVRGRETLRRVVPVQGFVSPRMKIRFDLSGEEMVVYRPDGRRFLTPEELDETRQQAEEARQQADDARRRADRLAELSLKLLAGTATDEEKQELARLAAPPSA
jgi:Uma2 family endonuclease